MSAPDLLLDKLFAELDYPERVEFWGPRIRLAKMRLTISALILLTFLVAIVSHNNFLAIVSAGSFILYVAIVCSIDRPSKRIFALTTTRVLEITADQVSVYASREDIEGINGHKIQFSNGLPPLSLLVQPRGAMIVYEKLGRTEL